MSRRKKRAGGRRRRPAEANRPAPADRARPQPNPPRPNKAFLITTAVLLIGWVAVLVVLALVR